MSDCIFCKIIEGQIPCKKVYEDEKVLAFNDINPAAPVHVLIIPKEHIESMRDITAEHEALIGHIHSIIRDLANEFGLSDDGYRIVNNCGNNGGQTVPHLHYHLMGGRSLTWPPG